LPSESEFNSSAEADFAEKWGDEVRNGWTLRREAEVLYSWQKTFLPDFKFRRAEGKSAMMEIIGFWTPEYTSTKRTRLSLFSTAGESGLAGSGVSPQPSELIGGWS
jgi:predicted nuclease of restriction endonuclease-like RecB superfamily